MEDKHIQNPDSKTNWKKEIIIGVVSSLITSLIYKIFPQFSVFIFNSVLDFLNNISTSYSNKVFKSISFGTETYPFFTLSLFLLFGFWFLAITLSSKPSAQRRIANYFRSLVVFMVFLFVITMSKYTYINTCIKCMNQNIKIASCYISDEETKSINAEYYQVDSKEDYLILLHKLEKIADKNGAEFYDPFS